MGPEKWNRMMGSDDIKLGKDSALERDIPQIPIVNYKAKDKTKKIKD